MGLFPSKIVQNGLAQRASLDGEFVYSKKIVEVEEEEEDEEEEEEED